MEAAFAISFLMGALNSKLQYAATLLAVLLYAGVSAGRWFSVIYNGSISRNGYKIAAI